MTQAPTTPGFNPEKILADFERAWASGAAPAIDLFLPPTAPLARTALRELLLDLIPIDLEYRWCAHGPRTPGGALPARPRIDDYGKTYAGLGPVEQLPAELIAAEYRVRCWSGEPPRHEEYPKRFAWQAAALRTLLAEIDAEIAEEHARVERSCASRRAAGGGRGPRARQHGSARCARQHQSCAPISSKS